MGQLNLQKLDTRIDKYQTELDELRAKARASEHNFRVLRIQSRKDHKYLERSLKARDDWQAAEGKASRVGGAVAALLKVRSHLVELRALEEGMQCVEVDLPGRPRPHGENQITGTLRGVVGAGWGILTKLYALREESCGRVS